MEYLADLFGTTTEEISRKIHNLRSQFNNELRKLKKRGGGVSSWEYFELLTFLKSAPSMSDDDPLDGVESVNITLAEFQEEEEREFGQARTRASSPDNANTGSPGCKKPTLRVAASTTPLPSTSMPIIWSEQQSIQPRLNQDECQIFGDFVASELRTLRPASRKKLKRIIQKAILQIGEEEDDNMLGS